MKTHKQALAVYTVGVIASIIGVIVLGIMKLWILVIIGLLFLGGFVLSIFFEIRDFNVYQKLSADMVGKSLEERLKILKSFEECWVMYASDEEVRYFKDVAAIMPENSELDYLLERASMHGK